MDPNSKLICFMNPAQAEAISQWRAGQISDNTIIAKHDYVPGAGAPAYFQPDNLVGKVAPESYAGLKVQGSYGDLWIVSGDFVPAN